MITFNSLNATIDDIQNEIRNNNIAESESINRNQIMQWILQYRAVLIKQDLDKGRDINPSYVQELRAVHISNIDYAYGTTLTTGKWIANTDISVPKTIDFHFKLGILAVTDMFGNVIQLMTEQRANMQMNRKYTGSDYVSYIKGDKVIVTGPGEIEYINIKGIFENPYDLIPNATGDELFPIPINMLPVLKEMIMIKELKLQLPVDNSNNSSNDIENITSGK